MTSKDRKYGRVSLTGTQMNPHLVKSGQAFYVSTENSLFVLGVRPVSTAHDLQQAFYSL